MAASQGGIGGGRPCVPRKTYQSPPGKQSANGLASGGYEGPIVQIGQGLAPFFVSKLEVYIAAAAAGPLFLQIFDGSFFINQVTNVQQSNGDVPVAGQGNPWNPISVFQINPGQTLNWEPPEEGCAELTWHISGCDAYEYRKYYDDYGFPFEAGCIVALSTTDQGFTAAAANVMRVMARIRGLTAGATNA